jgi:hypothetical protein
MIDQDAPHQLGRQGKKVRAIFPVHAVLIDQTQVGLVDQSARLQGVAGIFLPHVMMGQTM